MTSRVWPTSTVVVERQKSNWWWILPAALLVGALVAYMNRERLASALGMSAVARPRRVTRVAPRRGAQVTAPAAPAPAPAAPSALDHPGTTTAGCVADGMPKPFNVYQDNLSGSNDITVGPGVALDGVGAVPVEFSGQCSGVNPAAVWQSTQLLPSANCGQALDGTSDWSLYSPADPSVVNFLSAGELAGQDTIMTSLKLGSLDLRPEPQVSNCFQSPWNQSSYVQDAMQKADWSHSLVA